MALVPIRCRCGHIGVGPRVELAAPLKCSRCGGVELVESDEPPKLLAGERSVAAGKRRRGRIRQWLSK